MKTPIATLLALLVAASIFGQDSIPANKANKLLVGIYVKEKEFLERKPSITKPFRVVPNLEISLNEEATKMDTIDKGIKYEFLDSSQKHTNGFGFCDGNNIYLGNNNYGYVKMDYIGKFSFISTNYKFGRGAVMKVLIMPWPIAVADILINPYPKARIYKYLFFVNKNGDFHEATGQAIAWLLKDDKDLLKEFNAEKKYSNDVFRKYLIKMNERYPES